MTGVRPIDRGTSGTLGYNGETTTETASIKTAKILINSTISAEGACFACWDVGNFYTNLRLETTEYIRIHIKDVPGEVIEEYNIMKFVNEDGYIYCENNRRNVWTRSSWTNSTPRPC